MTLLFKFLFYGFLVYLAYKLIFNFIIPIYRTTKQVRRSFRDMQEQMREHSDAAHGQTQYNTNTASKKPANGKVGDYIDFEEVKD